MQDVEQIRTYWIPNFTVVESNNTSDKIESKKKIKKFQINNLMVMRGIFRLFCYLKSKGEHFWNWIKNNLYCVKSFSVI